MINEFVAHFGLNSTVRLMAFRACLQLNKEIMYYNSIGFCGIAYHKTVAQYLKIGRRFGVFDAVTCATANGY